MRKTLAGLLVFIFIPLFLIVLLSFNLQAILLNKDEVKKSLEKTDFYERLIPSIISDLYKNEVSLDLVTETELTQLISATFPPTVVKTEVEKTLDQVYPYILSETDSFNLTYDLKIYKKTFLHETEKLVLSEIKSLPKCNTTQLNEFDLESLDTLPDCLPLNFTSEEILEAATDGNLDSLLANIPNEIVVTEKKVTLNPTTAEANTKETTGTFFAGLKESIANFNRFILIGFGILFSVLVLISLLRWGSYKSMAKWVGWTLLISVINFTLVSFLIYSLPSMVQGLLEELNKTAAITSSSMSDLMGKMFFGTVLPQTIILLIVSLVLITLPHFIKSKQKHETTPQPQPQP